MIQVSIPGFRQIVSDDERPYTVYQINVKVSGRIHSIDKRYREFHALHKQVKKKFDTPDFPPKKVRQLSSRGMEHRRVTLEAYLQGLLDKDSIPKSLLTFLRVKNFRAISYEVQNIVTVLVPRQGVISPAVSLDDLDTCKETSTHQPIMVFESDPFLNVTPPEGGIPDILADGVRQGLYDDPESSSSAS